MSRVHRTHVSTHHTNPPPMINSQHSTVVTPTTSTFNFQPGTHQLPFSLAHFKLYLQIVYLITIWLFEHISRHLYLVFSTKDLGK
jgi:hypothetical protein